MLVRAAGTGFSSHTALISESTDTARLRLITSIANTARCFGAPSGTRAPPAHSCNGPRTPNPRRRFPIVLSAFRVKRRRQLTIVTSIGCRAVLQRAC